MSQTLLLTGASKGIGAAAAALFGRKGYDLILTGNSHMDELYRLKQEMEIAGRTCHVFQADFSDASSLDRFLKELAGLELSCDILINNAGISNIGLLQDLSPAAWEDLFRVNVTAMYRMCAFVIPLFLKQGHGKILNVSSVWGLCGASCEAAYSASKGAVNSFTKALAKELAPSGIPVNAVAFGAIDTSMNDFLSPGERRDLEDQIPAGRLASPEEAAEILYHMAGFGNYVTGQILTADGGWI